MLQHADDNLHESKLAFHAEHGDREEMRAKMEAEANVSEIRPRVTEPRGRDALGLCGSQPRLQSPAPGSEAPSASRTLSARAIEWARGLDVDLGVRRGDLHSRSDSSGSCFLLPARSRRCRV